MKFRELRGYLFEKYPDWTSFIGDNDGVEVCTDEEAEHSRILLALDLTLDTLKYASENGYDCIITHHPVIYTPIKKLDVGKGNLSVKKAVYAAAHKINCISLHTRFDSAEGGVTDMFIRALGLESECSKPFGAEGSANVGKIVTLTEEVELGDFLCGIRTSFADFYADNFKNEGLTASISYIKGQRNVKKAGIVGGGGADFISEAVKSGADTFITGEGSYHKVMDAHEEYDLNVIMLGHFETEIISLPALRDVITDRFGVPIHIYVDAKIKRF